MIETVQSVQFNRQIETYNRPIESICRSNTGLDVYYIKYARSGFEADGLIAEIICHFLARKMHLKTPDIAYVKLGDHPIPSDFQYKNHLKVGRIVFGSKKVMNTEDELTQLDFVFSKHEFNRLKNPQHLLRIGLFDLWIGNKDRTAQNFNLFLTSGRKQKLVLFDHYEAFNKIAERSFNEINTKIDVYSEGFLSSYYAHEMLGWIPKSQLKEEVDNFFDTIKTIDIEELLEQLVKTFPPAWNKNNATTGYIFQFLKSKARLQEINIQVTDYINYYLSEKP